MPATLRDIATEVGVSVTTVSRGLAGYDDVAEETRQRIVAAAQRLGYQPNLTAQRLQKRRTDTLGFILPTLTPRFSDPFFSEFIAGIGNEAATQGYDLLVSVHPPGSDAERAAYRRAAAGGWVDGLFVVRTRVEDERITMLCDSDLPFVAFGRTSSTCDFACIDEDSEAGVRSLVNHFVEQGHERIAFVGPPQTLMFGHYRAEGFRQAMAAFDLPIPEAWVVEGDMTQQGGGKAMAQLLASGSRPTAVIFGNDLMAIGALDAIRSAGLTAGEDIVVGGFDDIPLSSYVSPALTTVSQPIYDIAQRLCAMLIDVINGRSLVERRVLLSPSLIIRESSGFRRQTEAKEVKDID